MGDHRTIEDVLSPGWSTTVAVDGRKTVRRIRGTHYVKDLHTATADGPVHSENGSLVVHRTDPELAQFLLATAELSWTHRLQSDVFRRAAALLAAPAPADPEEDDHE